jgi:Zn-dependent protease with chaperone function
MWYRQNTVLRFGNLGCSLNLTWLYHRCLAFGIKLRYQHLLTYWAFYWRMLWVCSWNRAFNFACGAYSMRLLHWAFASIKRSLWNSLNWFVYVSYHSLRWYWNVMIRSDLLIIFFFFAFGLYGWAWFTLDQVYVQLVGLLRWLLFWIDWLACVWREVRRRKFANVFRPLIRCINHGLAKHSLCLPVRTWLNLCVKWPSSRLLLLLHRLLLQCLCCLFN